LPARLRYSLAGSSSRPRRTLCDASRKVGTACRAQPISSPPDGRPAADSLRRVTHPDRLLLGPGPSNPYPEVMEAFQRPVLGHLDPDFLTVLDEIADRLRTAFRTENALTLPISGTGSAGMEACFVNLLEPGDTAIVGVNGVFGERMCDVARRCGANVVRVEERWGRAIDPQRLLDAQRAHAGARLLAVVHAETSTGVENDIAPLAALQGTDTLLLVDTVTSLGGVPVEVDAWGVDAVYSGTQKCLGVPPGLAPVSFSARAVERFRNRTAPAQSWYLDLALIADYVGSARRYHHTAPISMLYALHAGLGVLLDEGLEAAHARHRAAGQLLQEELPDLGFRLFAQERRLPQLTSAWLPEGVDDAKVRNELRVRFGIEVGGGLGDLAGKGWRIGLMGHAARETSVVTLVGALGALL
jgi:alanine-glyoxylate transaminase/serine-glyoxylate transaminase/serine-pyruvate transaminase